MSKSSKSKGFAEPRAPYRGTSRRRSSSGVEVVLQGWKVGLNKILLTKTFQTGGTKLSDAVKLTARVLEGEEVRARFKQFPDVAAAQQALQGLGVDQVRG